MSQLEVELEQFKNYEQRLITSGFIVDSKIPFCYQIYPKNSSKPFLDKEFVFGVSAIVHGNECVGIQVVNSFLNSLCLHSISIDWPIVVFLGNVPAYLNKKRFLEKDLNRVFLSNDDSSLEEKRAQILEPVLKQIRYHVDLHQTIQPTCEAMMIFQYKSSYYQFLRSIAPDLPFILFDDEAPTYAPTALTGAITYFGGSGVTFELGHQGFNYYQRSLGFNILYRSIEYIQKVIIEDQLYFDLKDQTEGDYQFSDYYIMPESDSHLVDGLVNFSDIKKGDCLGYHQNQKIIAPMDGKILFPKYGKDVSTKEPLFRFLVKFNG